MELTSYTAAYMVLCLRFAATTVLVAHRCHHSCGTVLAKSKALFSALCVGGGQEAGTHSMGC